MKPIAVLIATCFAVNCTLLHASNTTLNIRDSFIDQQCDHHQSTHRTEFFSLFLKKQYQKVNELKDVISDKNYQELQHALTEFNAHWVMLNDKSYQACEKLARCEFIKQQYISSYNNHERNRVKMDKEKQTMCDKSSFEFDITRVKMASFYSDIERLELVRDHP